MYKIQSFLYFSEFGNGWSPTILKSENQINFLKVAMKSVVHRDWTYYIGGSGDPSTQVTPFKYCLSEYSMDQSGNILNIPMFCIIANSRD